MPLTRSGGSGVSTGASLAGWQSVSAAYTAVAGDRLVASLGSATFTITLPAAPTVGAEIAIALPKANHYLVIAGNGNLINGQSNLIALPKGGILYLIFVSGAWTLLNAADSAFIQLQQLTYSSNGDSNGLFYGLGSNFGQVAWANPYPAKLGAYNNNSLTVGSLSNLFDRASNSNWGIYGNADSLVGVDLGLGNALIPTRYSIQHRGQYASGFLRNWKLQGSNNFSTWDTLDNQVNNQSINSIDGWFSGTVAVGNAYRYLRILQTGVDSDGSGAYLVMAEFEVYGIYGNFL